MKGKERLNRFTWYKALPRETALCNSWRGDKKKFYHCEM
jgi:hypothetical protein